MIFSQLRQHLVGRVGLHVAEDVRVARDELLDDARDDVVDRELPFLAKQLGLEHDLEEKVAELLAERLAIARVDRVDDLARLFEHVFAQRLERLLAVPRAAVRREEAAHDADEADERRAVLLFELRHGTRLFFVERRNHEIASSS